MARDEELKLDPTCERCAAPLVDMRSAVDRGGETYCCVNCARASATDPVRGMTGGQACSRCGAPIVDRSHAVSDAIHAFCCGNCSAAGVAEEPISPEAEA